MDADKCLQWRSVLYGLFIPFTTTYTCPFVRWQPAKLRLYWSIDSACVDQLLLWTCLQNGLTACRYVIAFKIQQLSLVNACGGVFVSQWGAILLNWEFICSAYHPWPFAGMCKIVNIFSAAETALAKVVSCCNTHPNEILISWARFAIDTRVCYYCDDLIANRLFWSYLLR